MEMDRLVAKRIKKLPPYLFAEIDRKNKKKMREGADIINLGVGDPDLPTPEHIVEACREAAREPENHRYPSYEGMPEFRGAVAERYQEDYGIGLDPAAEVLTLIGSKEGVHNIHFAFVDPGDVVLYTNPGYPVYQTGPLFAGGTAHAMPLSKENSFLPDLGEVPGDVARKAKLMWINYPNNPTSAVADRRFYREVVDFAADNEVIVCSDEAYSALTYNGERPPTLLEVEGSREVGVVMGSLSKTYCMTGWRLGYAVGNTEVISGLGKVKTNVDSGASQIIQRAGIAALLGPQTCVAENVAVLQERRDCIYEGLGRIGLACKKPEATFYAWVECPDCGSIEFADLLLEKADVVVTPGVGFGEHGEGYVRFAFTQPVERLKAAIERIEKVL